jgi:hypothetical protein
MYKNRAKILAESSSYAPGISRINRKQRSPMADEMEKLLLAWIDERAREGDPVSTAMILEKARLIHGELLEKRAKEDVPPAGDVSTAAASREPKFLGERKTVVTCFVLCKMIFFPAISL